MGVQKHQFNLIFDNIDKNKTRPTPHTSTFTCYLAKFYKIL